MLKLPFRKGYITVLNFKLTVICNILLIPTHHCLSDRNIVGVLSNSWLFINIVRNHTHPIQAWYYRMSQLNSWRNSLLNCVTRNLIRIIQLDLQRRRIRCDRRLLNACWDHRKEMLQFHNNLLWCITIGDSTLKIMFSLHRECLELSTMYLKILIFTVK